MKTQIMYIEHKDGLAGDGRIGRVTFSNSGSTLYYRGAKLQSLKGASYKANYYDVETGDEYWVSGCKKNGEDTLYPGVVEIDDDVRKEYWTEIRNMPDNVEQATIRTSGKYSRRKPK